MHPTHFVHPVPTEDAAAGDARPATIWRALGDLVISVLVVCALALTVSFITAAR